jgi:hypothetical protein
VFRAYTFFQQATRYNQKVWKEEKGGVSSWVTKPTGQQPSKEGDTAMEQKTTTPTLSSSQMWERLEVFVREQIQRFIQALLEEEVTALLGRRKSVRRAAVDTSAGLRNG